MPTAEVIGCVPHFNNSGTVRLAVESLLAQRGGGFAITEVIVVDDGSSEDPSKPLSGLPVRIVRLGRNLGRGAARARAMSETRSEFVLWCDATNVLPQDFAARAITWFAEERVAAVCGVMTQGEPRNVAERWRGRHLYKASRAGLPERGALLATGGALVRASALRDVGGFDARLRQSEDRDLGLRLLAAGFDVVRDPALRVTSMAANGVFDVLERHWRWHCDPRERATWTGYLRNLGYAVKVMAGEDARAGDYASILISLASPHYQFWRSTIRAWSWSRRNRVPARNASAPDVH